MARYFLAGDRITEFVSHLMGKKQVFAPQVRGRRSLAFEQVSDPAAVVLDYGRTMQSVRKYFLPPREELLSFDLDRNSCLPADVQPMDAVFLGVHSYDLEAVRRLDHSFTDGVPDRNYIIRRQGALFVGVSYEPDNYHFAGSVGIDSHDTSGFVLFLSRLKDGYVLDVLAPEGEELLTGFDLPAHEGGKPAPRRFQQHIHLPQANLRDVMAASYDNPVWAETAVRCVGCGTCNLVCPTCYCFNVEENVEITVDGGNRQRHWDGCMLRVFSEVAGGEVFREGMDERQRHRIMRKFKYISDETGQPWCVGCGRCTAYCTADISIVNIVNQLINDFERTTAAPI